MRTIKHDRPRRVGHATENFELVSVQALVDEEEKIHEGEWVATVKVKDGLPFAELTRNLSCAKL
ncbi:MAG: hypothetical protein V8R91_06100 [Butyricimonas faecihominis]